MKTENTNTVAVTYGEISELANLVQDAVAFNSARQALIKAGADASFLEDRIEHSLERLVAVADRLLDLTDGVLNPRS